MTSSETTVPEADTETIPIDDTKDESRSERERRYQVIVLNDDVHTFPYVIEVLQTVCGHTVQRAFELTERVHRQGRAIVWIGPLEAAREKRAAIRRFGPDLFAIQQARAPLGVRVEPFD